MDSIDFIAIETISDVESLAVISKSVKDSKPFSIAVAIEGENSSNDSRDLLLFKLKIVKHCNLFLVLAQVYISYTLTMERYNY